MTVQTGYFLDNLVLFGRLLRALGMEVSTSRMMDLIQALKYIKIGNQFDFYYACRSLLVRRREDIELFDEAFDLFWNRLSMGRSLRGAGKNRDAMRGPQFIPPPLNPPAGPPAEDDGKDRSTTSEKTVLQVVMTYSDREQLRQKDFANCTGEEVDAIKDLMTDLAWQLGTRRTRRLESGPGRRIDLRRTLRRNLKYGGEILEWAYRQPKHKNRPLVILADISGSMERYTRLLLHFIYSLTEGLEQKVEAFVFSTRLTRISRQLRGRDVERAMKKISRSVHDWSGGTRIGDALKDFNFDWSRRVLGQGAVVLLISDGWDRGNAETLRREIARLQRSCYRLIWLNPLLGDENYEPLARGMRTALPYLDDFLPVHNLASLEDLARHLHLVERGRLTRRSTVGT